MWLLLHLVTWLNHCNRSAYKESKSKINTLQLSPALFQGTCQITNSNWINWEGKICWQSSQCSALGSGLWRRTSQCLLKVCVISSALLFKTRATADKGEMKQSWGALDVLASLLPAFPVFLHSSGVRYRWGGCTASLAMRRAGCLSSGHWRRPFFIESVCAVAIWFMFAMFLCKWNNPKEMLCGALLHRAWDTDLALI